MWWIKFDSIICNDAEENKDEPYIVFSRSGGRRRTLWSATKVETGERRIIDHTEAFEDSESATIELWENDDDHPFDGKHNDQLSHRPNHFITSSGVMRVTLNDVTHMHMDLEDDGDSAWNPPYRLPDVFRMGSGSINSATYTLYCIFYPQGHTPSDWNPD